MGPLPLLTFELCCLPLKNWSVLCGSWYLLVYTLCRSVHSLTFVKTLSYRHLYWPSLNDLEHLVKMWFRVERVLAEWIFPLLHIWKLFGVGKRSAAAQKIADNFLWSVFQNSFLGSGCLCVRSHCIRWHPDVFTYWSSSFESQILCTLNSLLPFVCMFSHSVKS